MSKRKQKNNDGASLDDTCGGLFRYYRETANMKQIDVASRMGIGATYYSQVENGIKNCTPEFLQKFASAVGLSQNEARDLQDKLNERDGILDLTGLDDLSREWLISKFRQLRNMDHEDRILYIYSDQLNNNRALSWRYAHQPFRAKKMHKEEIWQEAWSQRSAINHENGSYLPIVERMDVGRVSRLIIVSNALLGTSSAFVALDGRAIVVNERCYSNAVSGGAQERFILAHELAHCLLHRPLRKNEMITVGQGKLHDPEFQADEFARELLAPHRHIPAKITENQVRRQYGVPLDVARSQIAKRAKLGLFANNREEEKQDQDNNRHDAPDGTAKTRLLTDTQKQLRLL